MPARFSAICMQRIGAVAVFGRRGDVIGVARQAVTDDLGIDLRAARLGVLQLFEHDDAGALAHDEAVAVPVVGTRGRFGSSLKPVDSARQAAKPASASRPIGDSAPPATITSASPSMISRAASPIACAPVEQAVTTAWFGPLSPCRIETWPDDQIDQPAGNEEGRDAARALSLQDDRGFVDAARGRRCRSRSARRWRSAPRAVLGSQPASSSASSAAAIAVDDEVIDLALFLRLHPVRRRLKVPSAAVAARDLAGDLGRQVVDLEVR